MAKQLAISTQLKNAQARIAELEKKLTDAVSSKDNYCKMWQEGNGELAALHDVIDTLPNAPARRDEGTYSDRKVLTRLAGYFASRG